MPIGTTQFSNFPYYERLDLLLAASCANGYINSAKRSELVRCELTEPLRAHAFGIDSHNMDVVIAQRTDLFNRFLQDDRLSEFPLYDDNPTLCLRTLWRFWLPLAINLANLRSQADRPIIQGILGGQGTGKTTLAKALSLLLKELGSATIALSIDDLYKTHAERQQLKAEDPRFIRRGPPGTHDIDLGLDLLDRVQVQQFPIHVPRFDKSLHAGDGDRIEPLEVNQADIVLFEGWFVGVEPVDAAMFDQAPDPIVTEADRQFARDCNIKLRDYLPLWQRCDRLAVLKPVDYRLSQQWRMQAEHDAIALGKDGMSDAEIAAFVEYFWKALHPNLFIAPLVERSHLVVCIESDHSVGHIYGKLPSM
jgi:D-glycerate 3-kinase